MTHDIYFILSVFSLLMTVVAAVISKWLILAVVAIAGMFFLKWLIEESKENEKTLDKNK